MTDDKPYLEEELLSSIDPNLVDKWGDPNKHPETQFSRDEQQALLHAGREMFLSHHTRDGFPMVTVHVYCVLDDVLWSTSVKGRVKVRALQNDPRCGVCISSAGLDIPFAGAMALRTRVEVVEDPVVVERVCREHGRRYYNTPKGQELFFRSLFTPNRVALRFTVDKLVSWKNIGVVPR
jgi:Pyridoxamine 5'-phosphate oxidase